MNAKPLDLLIQDLLSYVTVCPDKLTCRNVQTALKKTKYKINRKNAITFPIHGSSTDTHIFGTSMRHNKFPKHKLPFL